MVYFSLGACPVKFQKSESKSGREQSLTGSTCGLWGVKGQMPGSLPRRYKEQVCLVLLLYAVADYTCDVVAMRASHGNVGKRLTNPAVCVCATLLGGSVEGGADFVNGVGVGS